MLPASVAVLPASGLLRYILLASSSFNHAVLSPPLTKSSFRNEVVRLDSARASSRKSCADVHTGHGMSAFIAHWSLTM
ncbi:uncharacterized protein B0H18DRAFT_983816, partial [Fomitopsis serialis]|uniref:uncharacterized protein n=1 Tax=Fomitopsis serialis TaxID=139415 RepID=UPI0020081525